METANHPSVFSRLNFDGKEEEKKNMGVEEKLIMVEAEVERRRRRRRSDERRQDCEGGKMLGLRESPRKRAKDLGVSRRSSPIKKVNLKESPLKKVCGRGFQDQDLRERVRKTIAGAGDGREQVHLVNRKHVERETDEEVLARREKQISYGKNTMSYDTYLKAVEKRNRETSMPRTPDKRKKYSRRAWDGLVKSWKQQIHKIAEKLSTEGGQQHEGVILKEEVKKEEDFDKVMDDIEALVGDVSNQEDCDSPQSDEYLDWADEVEDNFETSRQRRLSQSSSQGLYSGEDTPSQLSGSSTGASTPRQLDLADSKDRFMQNHIFCWDLISKHPKYWNSVFTEKEANEEQDKERKDSVDV